MPQADFTYLSSLYLLSSIGDCFKISLAFSIYLIASFKNLPSFFSYNFIINNYVLGRTVQVGYIVIVLIAFSARRRVDSSADFAILYPVRNKFLFRLHIDRCTSEIFVPQRVLTERKVFVEANNYVCFFQKLASLIICEECDVHLHTNVFRRDEFLALSSSNTHSGELS